MWAILTTIFDRLGNCSLEFVWGFFARHAGYVQNLEDSLADVETTLNSLTASKEEVMQRVLVEEQQQKKRLASVDLWFERVDIAAEEGQGLIKSGDQELQRLCLGGYCSTRCCSTSKFGKKVDTFLKGVRDLLKEKPKESDQVTAETPASYAQKLAYVKTTLENLTASKKQVMGRVLVEEQARKKKRLDLVALWFERVDKAVADGQELQTNSSIDSLSASISAKEVDEFLNQLRDLLKEKFDQVTAEIPAEELVAELPCDPTVGMETKFEEVWSCLENNDVVGVYGMGGIGKTTLLTKLHNRFVDTRNDVLVIWVVVGKDTPSEKIQEKIGNKIGFPQDSQWGSEEVTQDIFNKLGGQKFVLFLDDIWKQVDLTKKIGIPTQEKLNGSKIIFSTRSSKVCHEMRAKGRIRVETLEWENAWKLFKNYAGEDTINIDPKILPLAESMAKKCDGLPIALKVIGRAMSGKLEPAAWRHSIRILKKSSQYLPGTEGDELVNAMEVEVFKILKFSYDNLPNDKCKLCFLYCALYPEDHFIDKDMLAHVWFCEDFWDNNGLIGEACDEAYSIIDTLVRSCLLEDEGEYVKMHDVIRDMALWIEKGNFVVMAGMQLEEAPVVEKWEGVKRLSLTHTNIEELTQVLPCHKLVTLFLNDNMKLHKVNEDFFYFMGALTVLDLSDTNLRRFPKSIEKLVSLQSLNISWTVIEKLPVELAMSKLKSLNIVGLKLKAKRSEGVISGLSSLQVLKMNRCSYSYEKEEELTEKDDEHMFFDELARLEHLKELETTIRSVHNLERNIKSPKLLTSITQLCLKDLEGSKFLNIYFLKDMKYLSAIMIAYNDLEEIHYSAVGTIQAATPLHMETVISFSYVRMVNVTGCKYLKDLTIMLVLLPNLTTLEVEDCDSIEEIISVVKLGEEVVDQKFFLKLNDLDLDNLPELRCIYQNHLPFSLLRQFYVRNCPLLKKLPLDSHSRDGPKIDLRAQEEWWEAIEWKDDATKAVLLPRFKCKFSSD